jgi:hypothetical protein
MAEQVFNILNLRALEEVLPVGLRAEVAAEIIVE